MAMSYHAAVTTSTLLLSLSFFLCLSFFLLSLPLPLSDAASWPFYTHVALSLIVLGCVAAVPLTHAITGSKRHSTTWRFFQPLRGGRRFVILQAFSWILFAFTVVLACGWFYHVAQEVLQEKQIGNDVIVSGSPVSLAALLSQGLMVASIFSFDPKGERFEWLRPLSFFKRLESLRSLLVVSILVNLQIVLCIFVLSPFLILSREAAAVFLAVFFSAYIPTFLGDPATNGRRRWDWLRYGPLFKYYMAWHGAKVVFAGDIDSSKQYIFGMAPHGVYPATAIWLSVHPTWREKLGALDMVPLGSSIFHYIPFLRDVSMWMGSRQVTSKSFQGALSEGKSTLVIPGGLSEIKFSNSKTDDICILTRHKGFIKMAIRHGIPLVLVYSFGETRFLDTIDIPYLSPFLFKYLKTPFPFFRGWMGLQIPRPVPVTVVVGSPIPVERNPNPTDAEVDALQARFYFSIKQLHEGHKKAAGYGEEVLHLVGLEEHPDYPSYFKHHQRLDLHRHHLGKHLHHSHHPHLRGEEMAGDSHFHLKAEGAD